MEPFISLNILISPKVVQYAAYDINVISYCQINGGLCAWTNERTFFNIFFVVAEVASLYTSVCHIFQRVRFGVQCRSMYRLLIVESYIMSPQSLMRIVLLTIVAGIISACGGSFSECEDCGGGFIPRNSDVRLIDVSGEVDVFMVSSYFSTYEYGPTQKFYHFTDEQSVITVKADNTSNNFGANVVVVVNIFNESETVESIGKWINNQHSDGIFGDAPEPLVSFPLPADKFSITSSAFTDHTAGFRGNEYDNYVLEVYIDNYIGSEANNIEVQILNFNVALDVHVITKDINADNTRVLDILGDTNIFSVESYYSAYEYGATQKFHHYLDRQAVLTIRVDNATTDFESAIEIAIDLFDENQTIESIAQWMNNAYSDALYANTPEPTSALLLPENKFSITAVNFVNHTVEASGSEYDNYVLEVQVDDYVILGELDEEIRINGFTTEVSVHVITSDGYALNPAASNAVRTEIVSYPTLLNAYGPTLQFYSFPGVQKVLVLRIDNTSADLTVSLALKRFGYDVSDELILGWINNQTAEAPTDAAEPIDAYVFPAESYTVSVSDALEHIVAGLGDEYDRYEVAVSSDAHGLYQWFSVADFVYNTNVYVMTKDVD